VFAQDPSLDVGIAGEAWAEVVRSAWLESGGSEETFEATFPQLADYARKQPAPSSNPLTQDAFNLARKAGERTRVSTRKSG
jgi:hypothetical protein